MISSGIEVAAPTSNNRHDSLNSVTTGVRSAATLPTARRIRSSVGPNPRNDILNDARQ
jgi:hypothetical protein